MVAIPPASCPMTCSGELRLDFPRIPPAGALTRAGPTALRVRGRPVGEPSFS